MKWSEAFKRYEQILGSMTVSDEFFETGYSTSLQELDKKYKTELNEIYADAENHLILPEEFVEQVSKLVASYSASRSNLLSRIEDILVAKNQDVPG